MSTSLARSVSGLSDKEIQHLFHALKREAAGMDGPSELDLAAWRDRQQQLLTRMARMSDTKKEALSRKLFSSRGEPVPDGETFYAWSRIEARARQEVAIRGVTSAVDLTPPGSQADQYEIGEDGRPTRVYYASYGSNLHQDRFRAYIEGGRPPGSSRTYDGCEDTTPPTDDIPIRYAGSRPHFALTSRVWRGGIAFIDAQKGESASALGRAYNISIEQFDQVVAQENGGVGKKAAPVPLEEALATGRSVTGPGAYETVLHIGDYNGCPVLTFTAPFSTRDALVREGSVARNGTSMPVRTNKPSAAYVRMIGSGLKETFGMDEIAQADYIRGCPGGDRWSRQDLVKVLRGQELPQENTAPATAGGYVPVSANGGKVITGLPASGPVPRRKRGKAGRGQTTLPAFSDADREAIDEALGRIRAYQDGAAVEDERRGRRRANAAKDERPTAKRGGSRGKTAGVNGRKQPGDLHPGVKTYADNLEQMQGVYRWQGALDDAKRRRAALRKVLQAQTEDLARGDLSEDLAVSSQAVQASRESDLAALDQEIAELTRKTKAAKAQTPPSAAAGVRKERYPAPEAKPAQEWRAIGEALHQDHQAAQAEYHRAVDAHARLAQSNAHRGDVRAAWDQIEKARLTVRSMESRLAEVDAKYEMSKTMEATG